MNALVQPNCRCDVPLASEKRRQCSQPTHSPNPSNGPHQRRQFARDGDVPVTHIHSDSGGRLQQLDAVRQALKQQTAAREETERLLGDARNTIRDLETKLGHERLARDEVTQRIEAERQQLEESLTAVHEELATERAMRARAQRERDDAVVATQQPPRRGGRPPKVARQDVAPDDSEIVEWWSPGWQEKYR